MNRDDRDALDFAMSEEEYTDKNKPELGDRIRYLGASDYSCITGSNKYKSYDMLVAEKKGLIVNEITDTFFIDRGNKFEEEFLSTYGDEDAIVNQQLEKVHPEMPDRVKAHLDAYVQYPHGYNELVEVKTKSIPKEYGLEEYKQELQRAFQFYMPEYVDQIACQYHLMTLNNYPVDKILVPVGLYEGRKPKLLDTVLIDITTFIKEEYRLDLIDSDVKKFWEDVDNPNYELDVETQHRVNVYKKAKELELEKESNMDIEDDSNDVFDLIFQLDVEDEKLKQAQDNVKLYKSRVDEIQKELEKKVKGINSISSGCKKLIIERKLYSGRYTAAKAESVVKPRIKLEYKVEDNF